MQRRQLFGALFALSFLYLLPLGSRANDCYSAAILTAGTPTTIAMDGVCDYLSDNQHPAGSDCPIATCYGDAWFRYVPGGNNLVNRNVTFNVSVSTGIVARVYLLYSESRDAGTTSPCHWNTSTLAITRYQTVCPIFIPTGGTFPFANAGLDGSGTFFLVVESTSNISPVNVTVTVVENGTCNAPTNDRCSSPTVLGLGNGIDPQSALGSSSGTWAHAAAGSTQCATKQRLSNTCAFVNPPTPTEDHHGRNLLGSCRYNGNLGDKGLIPTLATPCDEFLENTVFYRFQVPVTANNWYIHIGSETNCAQQPNNAVAMLFNNSLSCTSSRTTLDNNALISCGKFTVSGTMPSSAITFDGGPNTGAGSGLTLTAGQNYYLVFDGTRGSQCDFNILINRSPINPALPARILAFEGYVAEHYNELTWIAEQAENHAFFAIERSSDGIDYSEIGRIDQGYFSDGEAFSFQDRSAPNRMAYYRIRSADNNGGESLSEVVVLTRQAPGLELLGAYPVPTQDRVTVLLSTADSGQPLRVSLVDITGRPVLQTTWQSRAAIQEEQLDLTQLAAGLYILHIQQGSQRIVRRLSRQ
ncbi:MAG: hypothetical protein OHK0039_00460 [Bacteroidia bacterium]